MARLVARFLSSVDHRSGWCPLTIRSSVWQDKLPERFGSQGFLRNHSGHQIGSRNPPPQPAKKSSPSKILARSEEHTSELQSRLHLVCRLLLEKKKKTKHQVISSTRAL